MYTHKYNSFPGCFVPFDWHDTPEVLCANKTIYLGFYLNHAFICDLSACNQSRTAKQNIPMGNVGSTLHLVNMPF